MNQVTISTEEYRELVRCHAAMDFLLGTILEGATLSYNKEYLSLDDKAVSTAVYLIAPESFDERMENLKAEKEAQNGNV